MHRPRLIDTETLGFINERAQKYDFPHAIDDRIVRDLDPTAVHVAYFDGSKPHDLKGNAYVPAWILLAVEWSVLPVIVPMSLPFEDIRALPEVRREGTNFEVAPLSA